MKKLLIGFHHGIGDFIAFTPALRALNNIYDEIDLCCKPDLLESGFLQHCPYITQVIPCLEHPWGKARPIILEKNANRFQELLMDGKHHNQFYIPDNWVGKKPEVYVDYCCLKAHNFDPEDKTNWELEVWTKSDQYDEFLEHLEGNKPYMFVHCHTPLWPGKSFEIDELPEVKSFKGRLIRTDENKFPSINMAFLCMREASSIIIADSVFMWAAWAMNLSIDYVYFGSNDLRVHPLDQHRNLIKRSNIEKWV